MRIIKCPFWVVKNDKEKSFAHSQLKERGLNPKNIGYVYPFTIGVEGSFVFESDGQMQNHDFEDKKRNEKLVYKNQPYKS